MKSFEIGFVPQGWKRGNNLRFVRPGIGPNATVGQVWQAIPVFPSDAAVSGDDIACVTFVADDLPRVNAWLKWWQDSKTPNEKAQRDGR